MSIPFPPLTLTAVGSGRVLALNALGRPALLIFHAFETLSASETVNIPLRKRVPSAQELLIASIIDLHIVPRLARKMVEREMAKAYQNASRRLYPGMTPSEHILILPDWDASATRLAGLENTHKAAALLALDASGSLVDWYQGDDLVQQAFELVQKLGIDPGIS